jgi:hypothetical protein
MVRCANDYIEATRKQNPILLKARKLEMAPAAIEDLIFHAFEAGCECERMKKALEPSLLERFFGRLR